MGGSLRDPGLIFREALLLGHIGGVMCVFIAFGLMALLNLMPMIGEASQPISTLEIFDRGLHVGSSVGVDWRIVSSFSPSI